VADLMEIARRTRDRKRKESEQSKESPPTPEALPPFACFPSGPVPWNQQQAVRLTHDADTLVERLGVGGTDPEVQSAAALVVSANATCDTETLMFALAEFASVVRRAGRGRTAPNREVSARRATRSQ
jgi:hypothetical protein